MKLFKSSNIELIKGCQGYFRCLLPSLNVKERCQKFISKYENSVNTFCKYCNALSMYSVWLVFFYTAFCLYVCSDVRPWPWPCMPTPC